MDVMKALLGRVIPNILQKRRLEMKLRLRRLQWKSLEKGNVVMQIWLGKQMLGQSEYPITDDNEPLAWSIGLVPLTKPQKEVILCDKRFRVLIRRRFGKTFLAIQEMAKFSKFPNQKVWYISPSYVQSKTICWDMLKQQMIKHRWFKRLMKLI